MFTPGTPDTDITDKLKEYCPALSAYTDEELWVKFVNIWNKLMVLLCWNDTVCNSMLVNDRTFLVKVNVDRRGVQEIDLPHNQINSISTVTFQVYSVDGLEEEVITDPEKYWVQDTNTYRFYLSSKVVGDICISKCEDAYLKFEYNAGYDDIPECFYSVLCVIIGNALCQYNDCGGATCNTVDRLAMNAILTQHVIEGEEWKWDVPNSIVQDTLDTAMKDGLLSALFTYSNCTNKINFNAGAIC